MPEYIDLSHLTEDARKDLLHCLERYEVFMDAVSEVGSEHRQTERSQEDKSARFFAEVQHRVRLYRSILDSNGHFPLNAYKELLLDLDHLKYTIKTMFGDDLSFFKRMVRKISMIGVKGRKQLEATIDRSIETITSGNKNVPIKPRVQFASKGQIKETILMKCEMIDDIGIFFEEAGPEFLKAFWNLSRGEQLQVLQDVLRELHPDIRADENEKISKEIHQEIPFVYDVDKCSSCGKQIDSANLKYSGKCEQCGRVYCQLCIMGLVDTPGSGKCVCGAALTPFGMTG